MKVKTKRRHLKFWKVPTKCILLTFLVLTVYVCMSLISSTSILEVGMFIKMRRLALNNQTDSRYRTFIKSNNKTGLLNSVVNDSVKNGLQISDDGAEASYNDNIFKVENRRSVSQGHEDRSVLTNLKGRNEYTINKNDNETIPHSQGGSTVKFLNKGLSSFDLNEDVFDENRNNSDIDIFGNIINGTDKKRKLECDECFQHNFNYVIENNICKLQDSEQTIELIILITTTHKNTKARMALRATWLSFTRRNTANIRYAFLLGEQKESIFSETILKENDAFHDIIKEDFTDSYMNLTYKTIMGFKWAATKCAHAQFIMKTDDDMFVNIPNVLRMIRGPLKDTLQFALAGYCSQKAKPIRSSKSKWYASVESYPQQFYPGFCSGTGYVTSMNVAAKIYHISPSIPFFHLEDVYVALCLRKLGFKLQRVPGFNAGRPKVNPCLYKGHFLITAHQMTPLMLHLIWNRQCTKMRL